MKPGFGFHVILGSLHHLPAAVCPSFIGGASSKAFPHHVCVQVVSTSTNAGRALRTPGGRQFAGARRVRARVAHCGRRAAPCQGACWPPPGNHGAIFQTSLSAGTEPWLCVCACYRACRSARATLQAISAWCTRAISWRLSAASPIMRCAVCHAQCRAQHRALKATDRHALRACAHSAPGSTNINAWCSREHEYERIVLPGAQI